MTARSRPGRPALAALLLAALAFAPLAFTALLFSATPVAAQAPGDREGLRSGPRAKRDHEIRWREWGPTAFQEAKRTKRLVFLDITAVWCHWCHVMDETSYSDPDVIKALNGDFIPVRVDADRRPDVRDRYIAGGWPTTAILSAEGHVLVARTYLPAGQLKQMLGDIRDLYRKNKTEVDRKIAEAERDVRATWRSEPIDSASLIQTEDLVGRTVDVLKDSEDKEHGGFGGEPRFHNPDAVSFLLRVSAARKDSTLRAMAVHAVDGLILLQDSVWGGFYRYATQADWSHPHFEKMLDVNARAIESCLEVTRATGGKKYLDAARKAERYVNRWLWDERAGGYFGSQDADVGSHEPSKAFTAGEDYYSLSEIYRRKLGVPAVDSTFYADANARMASAALQGVLLAAWDETMAVRPLRALDRLWIKQRAPDGSLYHAMARSRGFAPGLLDDQVPAALAYLDAYEVTGVPRHLTRARALAEWIASHLEDRVGGGFRYAPLDSSESGRLLAGDKPADATVEAGTLYLRLYWLEERPEDLARAGRAFAYLRSGGTLVIDPARARLALRMEATPLRLAVVGGTSAAAALKRASFRVDAPEKVLRFYPKGGSAARWGDIRFPAGPAAALYVCGDHACAPPITEPGRVASQVSAFLRAGAGSRAPGPSDP
ncbi:MAG TPA: DUF255 domain-containing protein [Candidatus Angelobacter sp.]|nr:DUF255 domain-containing protein [Candidatus Angelobacter sp.]